jgi:hypothetical protein
MGGTGAGHKSERARLARLVNMAKARAARKREPLRWRSGVESRVIEQLVWQWWIESSGPSQTLRAGEWPFAGAQGKLVASGWRNKVGGMRAGRFQRKASPRKSGVSYMPLASAGAPFASRSLRFAQGKPASRPWAKLRVARLLGVSHTWVNKLVKRFKADPDRMRRRMAAFAPATLEKLDRAREETRRQRELGWLRGPIQMRRVKWMIEGKTRRGIVWTQSKKRRREGKGKSEPRVSYAELPAWCTGVSG